MKYEIKISEEELELLKDALLCLEDEYKDSRETYVKINNLFWKLLDITSNAKKEEKEKKC